MSRVPVGPLVTLAALVGGILAGFAAGASSARVALVAAVVALTAAALLRAPPGHRAGRIGLLVLGASLLGTAVTQRALHGLDVSPLAPYVDGRVEATVDAVLVDDPDASAFTTRALLRVTHVDGRDAGRRRVVVRAGGDVGPRLALLAAGDAVRLRGWFDALDGFDAPARWRHAVGTFHATDLLAARDASSPLASAANSVRALVLSGSAPLAPADRALLAGFLLGDTRGVDPHVKAAFRAAGLTHLTAVSGENVAFVMALVAPLLRRGSLRARFLGGLAVLVLFGQMTRWEPSVLRAVAMASLALLAGYLGRPAEGLRLLALAVTALLVADPFLLRSVGFLLSCGASAGIVLLAPAIAARLPGPRWAADVVAVTAAAQIGVAPVLLPVFGSIPVVALPANLVAVPLAGPLTVWGLLAGVVGGLTRSRAPVVASLMSRPTTGLLHAIVAVAEVSAHVPLAVDGRAAWGITALVAGFVAVRRAARFRSRVAPGRDASRP